MKHKPKRRHGDRPCEHIAAVAELFSAIPDEMHTIGVGLVDGMPVISGGVAKCDNGTSMLFFCATSCDLDMLRNLAQDVSEILDGAYTATYGAHAYEHTLKDGVEKINGEEI